MQTLNSQRITDIQFLLSVRPERLVKFFDPYREYLASCGWNWPDSDKVNKSRIESLAGILQAADTDAPAKMLDSLHTVSGLTNRVTLDLLFDQIGGLLDTFMNEREPFAGDVAIEAYLMNPRAAEQILSMRSGMLRRSYRSFQADSHTVPIVPDDLENRIAALGQYLDGWFDARGCGPGATAKYLQDPSHLFVTCEHGLPLKRQRTLDRGRQGVQIFRPLLDDFAVFDKLVGELRINAETASQRDIYRRMIGKFIFDNEKLFPEGDKFSLEPLIEYRHKALSAADIEGLDSVQCCGVKMLLPGHEPEEITSRRRDMIDVLDARMTMLRDAGFEEIRLTEAKFQMAIAGSRRSRTVTIKPPNVAVYARDGDAIIVERFLTARGFVTEKQVQPYEIPGTILALG